MRSPLAWDGNQKVRMIAELLLGTMQGCRVQMTIDTQQNFGLQALREHPTLTPGYPFIVLQNLRNSFLC